MSKSLEQRQAEKREAFQKQKKENEKEVEQKTDDWTYRKEGDLYPKIPFACNIRQDQYSVLKSSLTDHATYMGAIEDKEVNQYLYFKEHRESFESNLASQRKAEPGIKLMIKKDGQWDLIETFARGLPKGITRTSHKSSGSSGRGRSWSTERIKIEREAVERLDEVLVLEYQSNIGGEAGGRNGQDRDWNNYHVENFYRLCEAGK